MTVSLMMKEELLPYGRVRPVSAAAAAAAALLVLVLVLILGYLNRSEFASYDRGGGIRLL
jgi:hypothetical protein